MTCDHSLRVHGVQKGILLRETSLRDESGGRRWWSGGNAGGERNGG